MVETRELIVNNLVGNHPRMILNDFYWLSDGDNGQSVTEMDTNQLVSYLLEQKMVDLINRILSH